ncbi:MAG: phospho-sugar mutase [bacterium]|nr:phospho-sugar mutase [bacterium]
MEHVTDAELREELAALAGQEEEIAERFYRELEFGTGGLRGVLGAGSNRMNLYTVGKASQGYANYLKARFPAPSVAISYDSRIHSDLFARHAAAVFAANGVAVHLYPRLMPTPALSFAVRDLRCSGGVMITASHNPAPYNGYKVYGSDGCQITTEAAAAIQREIDLVDCFDDVPAVDYDDLCRAGRIAPIGEDTVERYLAAVDGCSLLPEGVDKDFSIVYTPLNGAGISCVPRCLRQHGFTRLVIPPEQGTPDGRFPTCPYPNPEIREALEVGLRTARETGSELLLATDPDCDRVGVAVREGEDYTLLNGNETGVLLFDFVCRMRRERGTMPQQPVAVKTIVTTPMAEAVARDYGVELINVLTGFKYIGEKIGQLEQKGGEGRYIFGFEESYGYLSGSYVRDKDGVNASLLICEMFAWYRGRGMSLVDGLRELQRRCGVYQTKLLTYAFEGAAGFAEMERRMNALRAAPPAEIGGETVAGCLDYDREGTGLPRSNVLRFLLEQGEAVIRPSGTEPKLKVYLTYWGENGDTMEKLCAHFDAWAR